MIESGHTVSPGGSYSAQRKQSQKETTPGLEPESWRVQTVPQSARSLQSASGLKQINIEQKPVTTEVMKRPTVTGRPARRHLGPCRPKYPSCHPSCQPVISVPRRTEASVNTLPTFQPSFTGRGNLNNGTTRGHLFSLESSHCLPDLGSHCYTRRLNQATAMPSKCHQQAV